ncbi:MAG: Ig-like domain-containing protein [Gemmatimonadota bacterium]
MKIRSWRFIRSTTALLTVVAIAACGDDDPTGLDPNVFELSIVSGGGGSGLAGTVVSEPLTAKVARRATGAPEPGVSVAWSVTQGSAIPTRSTSSTDDNGRASTLIELGAVSGPVQVTASVEGLTSVAFSSITTLPAPTLQSVSPLSADPGDTVQVRVNDLPAGFSAQVLFDGVAGDVVNVQSGTPSVLSTVVPPPVGVCSATSHPVDVRVRVDGITTGAIGLSVTVPADPFQVGQVLIIEAENGVSPDVQCALLPSDGATAKYLLVTLSSEFETVGQFQVTLGSNNVAVSRAPGAQSAGTDGSFHSSLRAFERQLLSRDLPRASRAAARGSQLFGGAPPDVGSQRQFWVINDSEATTGVLDEADFDRVTATLKFVGPHTLLYVDDAAPAGGLTDQDLQRLGEIYDRYLYETDLDHFGDVSDVDDNERVYILLSPTVNALTERGLTGFVVGFFFGLDIFDPNSPGCAECRFSNGGEILYGVVADPDAQFSDARTVERVLELLPGVTIHETQHAINFNWKVIKNGLLSLESLWLSEGEAHIAEEFGGDAVDAAGEIDLADDLYSSNFGRAAFYLMEPENFSLTSLSGEGELGERGAWWLFLRWIADQYGDFILRDINQSPLGGVANIEQQTGESFFRLFADWSVAVWADDLNIPNLPERYEFPKWDLRSIIRVEPSQGADPVYALQPTQMTFESFRGSTITQFIAGSSAFYVEIEAVNDLGDLQLELTATTDAGIAILRYE